MRKRKTLRRIIIAVMMLLLLGGGLTTMAVAQKTLVFMTTERDPASQKVFGKIKAKFESEYPEAKVIFEFLGSEDIMRKITTGIAAGRPPNGLSISGDRLTFLYEQGVLQPVTDIIDDLGRDDFVQSFLVQLEGEDYYVPLNCSIKEWWVRTDLLKKKGLPVPIIWEEYLEVLEALTEDLDGDGRIDIYGFALPVGTTSSADFHFYGRLFSARGHVFDRNGNVIFDKPPYREKFVRTVKFIKELTKYAPPGATGYIWGDLVRLYYAEKVASTWFAGRVLVNVVEYAPELEQVTKVYPYPYPYDGRSANAIHAEGWAMVKGAPYPELTKEMIKTMATGPLYVEWCHTVPLHITPTRYSVLGSPEYLANPIMQRNKHSTAVINSEINNGVNALDEWGQGRINPVVGPMWAAPSLLLQMLQRVILKGADIEEQTDVFAQEVRKLKAKILGK